MKILIFGIPGSGKTTLAKKLAKTLNFPLFHIDDLFFEKGWVEKNHEDFLKDIKSVLSNERWIIDGNAMKSLEIRYKEADLVIYCRLNKVLCLYRVFKRWIFSKGITKKVVDPDKLTSSVSWKLIKYLWRFTKKYKSQIEHLKNKYPETTFLEIKSKKEMSSLQKNHQAIFSASKNQK